MLDEREMQFLYKDGDLFHFMDTESYEQMHIDAEALGDSGALPAAGRADQRGVLRERAGRHPPAADGRPEGRGHRARASRAPRRRAQVKPATLETGLVVNVPSFVNTGDKVRVNTETGEYLSRA